MVANRKTVTLKSDNETVTVQFPDEGGWRVALSRTRGLAAKRLKWDPNINNLVANAYLQGAVDVGTNIHLMEKLLTIGATPQPEEDYHGA